METASELNVHVLQDFHSKWAKYWLITNEASNLQIIYQRKVRNFSPSTDEIILVHCFCCDRKQKVITVFVAAARMTASFCHSTFTCSCSVSVPQISCGRSKPGSDRALTMMVLGIYCSETYSQHREYREPVDTPWSTWKLNCCSHAPASVMGTRAGLSGITLELEGRLINELDFRGSINLS